MQSATANQRSRMMFCNERGEGAENVVIDTCNRLYNII